MAVNYRSKKFHNFGARAEMEIFKHPSLNGKEKITLLFIK